MTWVRRPRFGTWGDEPIAKVRSRLRYDLADYLERDPRVHEQRVTEYTLQSVIFEHVSWLLGPGWRVRVEDFIPGTKLKADLVIERLTAERHANLTCGVIAAEVKPSGREESILRDIKKLRTYLRRQAGGNMINSCLMMYLGPREIDPDARRAAVGNHHRRLGVVWIPKRAAA